MAQIVPCFRVLGIATERLVKALDRLVKTTQRAEHVPQIEMHGGVVRIAFAREAIGVGGLLEPSLIFQRETSVEQLVEAGSVDFAAGQCQRFRSVVRKAIQVETPLSARLDQ